jgi:hypothetical protein
MTAAKTERLVRQDAVDGPDEGEDERGRNGDPVDVGEPVAEECRFTSELDADRGDEECDEEDDQRAGRQEQDEHLLADERAVGEPVDDVEGGLENAEEPERAPGEPDPPDDSEGGGALADVLRDLDEPVDGALRERAPELVDQVARLRLLPGERDQRENEEQERHEGEEREVRDHRGQMSTAIPGELADDRTDVWHVSSTSLGTRFRMKLRPAVQGFVVRPVPKQA